MTSRFRRRALAAVAALAAVTVVATACSRPASESAASAPRQPRPHLGRRRSVVRTVLRRREGGPVRGRRPERADHPDRGRRRERPECRGRHFRDVRQRRLDRVDGDGRQPDPARTRVYEESDRYFQVVLRPGVTPQSIKTMGVFPVIGLYFTDAYLRSVGLDPAAVKLVSTSRRNSRRCSPAATSTASSRSIRGWRRPSPPGPRRRHHGDFGARYSQWLLTSESWLAANEELAARVFAVVADAAAIVNSDPDRAAAAISSAIQMDPAEAKRTVTQIDFVGRDFTPDDTARADDLVTFFRDQGKITGSVDTDTVMLHTAGCPSTPTPNDRSVCRPDRARFGQQNGIVPGARIAIVSAHSPKNPSPIGAAVVESAIRVVELSSPFTRFAGRILVGLGYDVVLVEPADGDPSRHEFGGHAYGHWHAGKKSVVIDLGSDAGRGDLARLVAASDVFLDGSAPGAEPVSVPADSTVHVRVTPFGVDGPRRDWAATDLTVAALGGMLAQVGYPDGPPLLLPQGQPSSWRA